MLLFRLTNYLRRFLNGTFLLQKGTGRLTDDLPDCLDDRGIPANDPPDLPDDRGRLQKGTGRCPDDPGCLPNDRGILPDDPPDFLENRWFLPFPAVFGCFRLVSLGDGCWSGFGIRVLVADEVAAEAAEFDGEFMAFAQCAFDGADGGCRQRVKLGAQVLRVLAGGGGRVLRLLAQLFSGSRPFLLTSKCRYWCPKHNQLIA